MLKRLMLTGAVALALAGQAHAQSASIDDPTGDFLSTYGGAYQADLDVTSFSVTYNSTMSMFLLQSTMAGTINPALSGFYAIGANTGTGTASFASLGLPGVRFNQVISVRKDGTASIGATALAAGSVIFADNAFTVMVPLSLLPSTGYDAVHYGFNIWPRNPTFAGNAAITDFAPNNATINALGEVPEPAAWALMVLGFGACGAALRTRKSGSGSPNPA